MLYQFTTNSFIELGTALAAVFIVIILWNLRHSKEVKYLIYLEVMVVIWATSYAFEFATTDLSKKIFWSKISYFGIVYLPLCYYLFTTAFSQKQKTLTKRNIFLLSVIPTIALVLALTNDFHHLIWTNVTLDDKYNLALYEHGAGFWIFYVYVQVLIFSGLYNLISSVYKFSSYYKTQIGTLLLGSIIPIVGNFVYISKVNPFPGFDWTPVSFVFTGIIIAFGVLRFRMFELLPFARKKLIDTMSDGVVVINSEGKVEDCNPVINEIFDIKGNSLIKRSIEEVFKDYPEIIKGFELDTEHSLQLKICRNGQNNYYLVKFQPIFYKNERFSGKMLVFNNINTMRNTEIKLKKINNQLKNEIIKNKRLIDDLDSFAHTVAHDLKNSLGSIYSSSEVIIENVENNDFEFAKELSVLVKESAEKSIQITDELLKLATTSHQNVKKDIFGMEKVFRNASEQLQMLIEQSKAKIIISDEWIDPVGYAPWVEEVWVNYLSNAIKYGGAPPVISVGNEKLPNGMIRYWIADNGKGIQEKDHSLLFKEYSRLAPESVNGYGLGLSIVKRIIDKLNGTVGVSNSVKNGEGSIFYFTLPATKLIQEKEQF